VVIVLAEIIVLAVTGFIYTSNFAQQVDLRVAERVGQPGVLMNSGLLSFDSVADEATMRGLVGEDLERALVVGANGNVFFALDPADQGRAVNTLEGVDASFLEAVKVTPETIQEPLRVISISPIFATDGQTVRFYLYLEATTAGAQAEKNSISQLFLIGSLATVLITSLIINLSFNFAFLRRVRGLLQVLRRAESGDLTVRVSGQIAKDEIGTVQAGVNAMIRQLDTTVNTLEERVKERTRDLEAARDRAEQSDQVKSAFLASMSHELRTPLNSIINFTKFVVEGDMGPVNAEQTELLTDVVGSGKHLLNLINDVLDMSKIEAGSLNLFIEDNVDVSILLNTTASTARSLLQGKPVRLERQIDSELPLIRADRQRILQILLNIISNACKFTEEGQITIRAQQREAELLISITDTGPGIAPEDQTLVFEAFQQTTTGLRQAGGTGLGMPIARNLAEAHGGRLWLESTPGKGATFLLALPVKSEALVPALA
jgi:signal transduction histidine kinase